MIETIESEEFQKNKILVETVLFKLPSVHFEFDKGDAGNRYTITREGSQLGLILVSGLGIECVCTAEKNRLRHEFDLIRLAIEHAIANVG